MIAHMVPIIPAEARLLAITIPISLHRMTAIIYVYFGLSAIFQHCLYHQPKIDSESLEGQYSRVGLRPPRCVFPGEIEYIVGR